MEKAKREEQALEKGIYERVAKLEEQVLEKGIYERVTKLEEQALEKEIYERVAKLEEKIYNHSENADDITEQIMDIVKISRAKDYSHKREVANEAILLLENHRFGE